MQVAMGLLFQLAHPPTHTLLQNHLLMSHMSSIEADLNPWTPHRHHLIHIITTTHIHNLLEAPHTIRAPIQDLLRFLTDAINGAHMDPTNLPTAIQISISRRSFKMADQMSGGGQVRLILTPWDLLMLHHRTLDLHMISTNKVQTALSQNSRLFPAVR